MKDKNLTNNYEYLSLEELTNEANKMIEDLENQKDLENSLEKYQNLIALNNIIEKKFQKNIKDINEKTKKKYQKQLLKKMQKELNKIANDTNYFLRRFIVKQKKSELIIAMNYGLFSGGKNKIKNFS